MNTQVTMYAMAMVLNKTLPLNIGMPNRKKSLGTRLFNTWSENKKIKILALMQIKLKTLDKDSIEYLQMDIREFLRFAKDIKF